MSENSYNSVSSTPADMKCPPITAPGQLWLMIEHEPIDTALRFTVVDANDVLGFTSSENMHTGKSVYVRRGKFTIRATIVIISDDKDFVIAECNSLNYAALAESIRKRNAASEATIEEFGENKDMRKRIRIANENSRSESPNCSGCATTTPAPIPAASSTTVITKSNSSDNKMIPPMTFDQQTQTDAPSQIHNTNFINTMHFAQLRDFLTNEIHSMRTEMNQRFEELFNNISNLSTVVDGNTTKLNSINQNINKKPQPIEYKIFSTNGNDITLEQIDSKSPEDSGNITPLHCSMIDSSLGGSSLNLSSMNTTLNSSSFDTSNNSSIVMDMIRSDFPENEIIDGMVQIGNNKTLVPYAVLESINWRSSSAATRKLLITIFGREVLSTHTLTGKPSPAFHDRDKPQKNQLDPAKVADIIQIVSKYCKVPETMVRCAITTKCADENKMSRQRTERKRKALAEDNKENMVIHGYSR